MKKRIEIQNELGVEEICLKKLTIMVKIMQAISIGLSFPLVIPFVMKSEMMNNDPMTRQKNETVDNTVFANSASSMK